MRLLSAEHIYFFMFQQITVVESVAEGTADSVPTVNTESTAKPPPFKDPAFMVTDCSDVCEGVFLFANLLQMLLLVFLSLNLDSIRGLVEQQLVKRTELGKILNRFWLWSELYHGSSVIPTVSLF